jgi:hypothetical protein
VCNVEIDRQADTARQISHPAALITGPMQKHFAFRTGFNRLSNIKVAVAPVRLPKPTAEDENPAHKRLFPSP